MDGIIPTGLAPTDVYAAAIGLTITLIALILLLSDNPYDP